MTDDDPTRPTDHDAPVPPGAATTDTRSPVPAAPLPGSWGGDALRQVFEHAPAALSIIDVATRTAHPNAAFRRLLGYDQPGAPPLDVTRITHPDDEPATAEGFRRLLTGEIAQLDAEKRYVRADGTELIGQMRATVLRDPGGRPWAVLSTLHDVSERHRAEALLAASEARHRALVENIDDAVVVLDRAGAITYASPSASRLLGVAPDRYRHESAFSLVHPDDLDEVLRRFRANLRDPRRGPGPGIRFRLLHDDGSIRHVEAIGSSLLDDPAVAGVVVTVRDLTDRQQVASALEVSETRFRRMLENISDTVTLVGADGDIIATTGNVREVMGFPVEFWTGRNAFELVHPDDVALVERLLERLLASPGAEVRGEFRTAAADGQLLEVEGSAVNLLDDPAVEAIVVTTRNITDRKQVERELAEARDEALRQLEIRNEFIASVSHELRTPIHGILGLTELLATAELDEQPRALARAVGRATESLRRVLDDLLDFAKIEAGRLQLVPEPVPLGELLRDTVTLYGSQAEAKGIDLRVELAGDLPAVVRTDGFRLRQVLANLVANAVKFTAAGEVVVAAGPVPAEGGDRPLVAVEVRDTGIGMPPEVLDRLFEPFSQAYASTAREFGGTGLGLTIARRLVEMLGGEVHVSSELGQGSTFRVVLPLVAVDDEPALPGGDGPRSVAGAAGRVLVVEDNPVNQLLIRHQLERLGYEPDVVGGGVEALERYQRHPPAVVLMDCQMPGLDGFATTERLRALERDEGRGRRVPVVALTANALPGERARCLRAGMDDYLAKPVGLDALGQVLAAWSGGGRPDRADPGSTAASAPPTLDVGALDQLVDELGGPDPVVGVVRTFLRELPGRLAAVADAVGAGDDAARAAVAHTLVGAGAAVGARRLAEASRRLEEASPGPGAEDPAAAVAREGEAVADALRRWLDDVAPVDPAPVAAPPEDASGD